MAYLEEAKIQKMLEISPLIEYTDYSITDATTFLERAMQTREQGYYIDDEEVILGVTSVAAPIKNKWDQVVAAVTVVGPKNKMHDYPLERNRSNCPSLYKPNFFRIQMND